MYLRFMWFCAFDIYFPHKVIVLDGFILFSSNINATLSNFGVNKLVDHFGPGGRSLVASGIVQFNGNKPFNEMENMLTTCKIES